ncbi:MAG: isochorismatase [Deltaproteobacteria bacterium]|nr:isochorismatase [Deltaproteobacteria bacterium]
MNTALAENYAGVFDGRLGFGQRAAVVVVDFVKAYTTPDSALYAPDVAEAVRHTEPLLDAARGAGCPVLFTRVLYHPGGADGGVFSRKVPVLRTFTNDNPLTEIVDELTVHDSDLHLVKQYASSFFGTSLASTLTAAGVDTLIVVGCSTSGCVRATAVDGCQYGFRVIVPRQCVGDRAPEPHEANLFDIDSKYGDVMDVADVITQLKEGRP